MTLPKWPPEGVKWYYSDDSTAIAHGDCRDILPLLPKVDLVLTDPPYGINENSHRVASRGKLAKARDYGEFHWDKKPIDQSLIDLAIQKGIWACMWGGNYYITPPASCWLVWDKQNGDNCFADCELAWTNFKGAIRMKSHLWKGMLRKNKEVREHPTQKPLDVMAWAISLAPAADIILDPFMGSGTTLRAAKDLGRKAIGIEIEEKYIEIAIKRLRQEVLI